MKQFKNIITPSKVEWAQTIEFVEGKGVRKYRGFEINHYLGCINDCSYCADKEIAKRFFELDDWTRPHLKFDVDVALDKLQAELQQLANRRVPQEKTKIIISFMSDPFQEIEGEYRLTASILKELANWEFDIWVLTKSTPARCHNEHLDDVNYYKLMQKVPHLHYGVTLNSLEPDLEREPNAPAPMLRLESLFVAGKYYGIDGFESLEPTYKESVLPVLQHPISREFCNFFILGKLNPSTQYNKFYRQYMPQCIEYLKENNKQFLVKSELREVLGLPDAPPFIDSKNISVKKQSRSLDQFFTKQG